MSHIVCVSQSHINQYLTVKSEHDEQQATIKALNNLNKTLNPSVPYDAFFITLNKNLVKMYQIRNIATKSISEFLNSPQLTRNIAKNKEFLRNRGTSIRPLLEDCHKKSKDVLFHALELIETAVSENTINEERYRILSKTYTTHYEYNEDLFKYMLDEIISDVLE
jgi:abortive infection bacteriophage resistance protein